MALSNDWHFVFLMCNFIIPTFGMLSVYYLIFITARVHASLIRARKRSLSPRDRDTRKSLKAAYTLAKIIIVYMVCWMPLISILSYYTFCYKFCRNLGKVNLDRIAHTMLVMLQNLNASINPVLYFLWCPDFRAIIRSWGNKEGSRTTSTSPDTQFQVQESAGQRTNTRGRSIREGLSTTSTSQDTQIRVQVAESSV